MGNNLRKLIELFFENPRTKPSLTPSSLGIEFEDVKFKSQGRAIQGWLTDGAGPFLIMTHGWGANAEVFFPIMSHLTLLNYKMLAFDVSNHGRSEEISSTTIKTFVEDIRSAIDFCGEEAILIGHSMGAAASIIAGNSDERVKAIVSISSFCSTQEIIKKMMGSFVPNILKGKILGKIEKITGLDLEQFAPCNFVCKRSLPLLLIHGKLDTTVPLEDSKRIKGKCPGVELEIIDGEDHMSILSNEKSIRRIEKFLREVTG